MGLIGDIRNRAKTLGKTIVLPESDDNRTIEALDRILDEGIAKIILIGKEEIKSRVKSKNLKDLEIIDPERYKDNEQMV